MGSQAEAISVPAFKDVQDYTTFEAQYTMRGADIVVHFYLPEELRAGEDANSSKAAASAPVVTQYWTAIFPSVLDPVARRHFGADSPRLQAKYTPEVSSWWLRAQGYSQVQDLEAYLQPFFAALDAGLDSLAPSVAKR
jgi:hypothetical protein